jgi:hypothetical protein
MLTQMHLKAPVEELMSQLEFHLPIATASALMKAEKISDQMYNEFFKIKNLNPQSFCDQYHEKMKFDGQGAVVNPPAGLEFFRVTVNVDPAQIYSYTKEPAFLVTYDLALKQTPKTTTAPESILRNSTVATTATPPTASRILFDDEGTPSAAPVCTIETTSPALTRMIQRYHGYEDSYVVISFHGPWNFIDTQEVFNLVFTDDPIPHDPFWTENPAVIEKMRAYAAGCGMYAFLRMVSEDYVGTVDELSYDAICGIGETLRWFSMEYSVQGKIHKCTPATLYVKYLSVIFFLSDDSRTWGFKLYDIYVNSLTAKIRKGINESKEYVRPDFTKLATHTDQINALVALKNALKNAAQKIFNEHNEQNDRFKDTIRVLAAAGKKGGSHGQHKSGHGPSVLANTPFNGPRDSGKYQDDSDIASEPHCTHHRRNHDDEKRATTLRLNAS